MSKGKNRERAREQAERQRAEFNVEKKQQYKRKEEKFSISEALRKREKYLEKLFFPQRVSQEKCLRM